MLRIYPNINPAEAAKAVRERFSNPPHPLLGRPGIFDAIIMKQTQDLVRKEKTRLERLKTSPTVGRVECFDDIGRYIAHHRINYDRLKQIGWAPNGSMKRREHYSEKGSSLPWDAMNIDLRHILLCWIAMKFCPTKDGRHYMKRATKFT
ncbi:hypothetical protein IV203_019656 [Nitzschia inconspicua]|uniref:Uncharacterized protein n=1 Tax=Nitzschia inconspicua TaxID=303405 RepID=A0A9K3M2Y1_9STRA|nr:hypothetical protein IV203_019656 [Nitzschia inconspicua]